MGYFAIIFFRKYAFTKFQFKDCNYDEMKLVRIFIFFNILYVDYCLYK